MSDEWIAAQVGIGRRTLARWKVEPAFQTRIAHHAAIQLAAVEAEGISNRQNRVAALNDRWSRMRQVIAARAEDMAEVPGGETGLLVRQTKSIGFGENNTVVEEYAVDTGLLRELRAHEEQAAKELSQWVDRAKLEIALSDEIQRLAEVYGLTTDEVRRDLAGLLAGRS